MLTAFSQCFSQIILLVVVFGEHYLPIFILIGIRENNGFVHG